MARAAKSKPRVETTTTTSKTAGGDITTIRKGGKVSTVQKGGRVTATRKGGAITAVRKGGEVTAVSRTAVDKAVTESISKLLSEAKGLYAPEGDYMAGIEAQLGRGRTRAVAGGMQGLAAAGLAGTSMAGGLARKYEEEVAAPTMAQATTQRLTALANLAQTEAGFQAQLAPRETTQKTTTSPLTTEQITSPLITEQITSPRLTEQITSPMTTEQITTPRITEQQTTSPLTRILSQSRPRPTPSWQQQSQKKQPMTQLYPQNTTQVKSSVQRSLPPNPIARSVSPTPAPAAPSLMQQADRYNLSGRYF